MCGDIMIHQNKMKQKKQPSHALVVSMMCAVIVTIVAQSLDIQQGWSFAHESDKVYASEEQSHPLWYHNVVSSSRHIQWNIKEQLNNLVDAQKQKIDWYIYWLLWWWEQSQVVVSSWDDSILYIQSHNSEVNSWNIVVNDKLQYVSFDILQNNLLQKKCEYELPIDNNDENIVEIIQRWLDRCLITVSWSHKVYPRDILTHEMMRTIASRAGFEVKMEYASSKPVSREQLFTFMYALQQHHNIGNVPVVVVHNPVTRVDYLSLLKKVFDQWSSSQVQEEKMHFVSSTPELIKEDAEYGKEIKIQNESWSLSSWLWIDKEMLKETVTWIIDKI